MGIEKFNHVAMQKFHGKLPGIVVKPRRTPEPKPTLRQSYRAARASLPSRVRRKPITPLIVRTLLLTGHTWSQVVSGRRLPATAAVKHRIAWMLYETTGFSMPTVAKIVGLTNHTTIVHARRGIENLIAEGATIDRGIPFLRPRDIARVRKIRADRERAARIRAEEEAAREKSEAIAYAAKAAARQEALRQRFASSFGAKNQAVLDGILRQYVLPPSRLVGPASSKRACEARDKVCFYLHRLGVHRDTLSAAFEISKFAITIARKRGELLAGENRP